MLAIQRRRQLSRRQVLRALRRATVIRRKQTNRFFNDLFDMNERRLLQWTFSAMCALVVRVRAKKELWWKSYRRNVTHHFTRWILYVQLMRQRKVALVNTERKQRHRALLQAWTVFRIRIYYSWNIARSMALRFAWYGWSDAYRSSFLTRRAYAFRYRQLCSLVFVMWRRKQRYIFNRREQVVMIRKFTRFMHVRYVTLHDELSRRPQHFSLCIRMQ